MSFAFSCLRLRFSISHGKVAPFTLLPFAPAVEQYLRQSAGCTLSSCDPCQNAAECAVALLFSKRLATDPQAVKRFQKPSIPVIIRPPYSHLPLLPDGEFTVDVTLVGTAIPHAGIIVSAMAATAANGFLSRGLRASLSSVATIGHQGEITLVSDDAIRRQLIPLPLLSLDINAGQLLSDELPIELQLVTPLRLVDAGETARSFSFGLFFRTLMRRLSSLSYYYCDHELPLDFRRLSEEAGRVRGSSAALRFSEGEGKRGQGGLTGTVRVRLPLEEFIPLLVAGSFCNVGKGAHAGFGQFRVVHPANP